MKRTIVQWGYSPSFTDGMIHPSVKEFAPILCEKDTEIMFKWNDTDSGAMPWTPGLVQVPSERDYVTCNYNNDTAAGVVQLHEHTGAGEYLMKCALPIRTIYILPGIPPTLTTMNL